MFSKAMLRHTISLISALLMLLLLPGCKSAEEVPVPGSLLVVQGDLQVAAAGAQLPTQLILRVKGTDGEPMEDTPVSFQVIQGGGAVDPPSTKTDANGEVKVKWTLGRLAAVQSLQAAVPGLDPIRLNATGVLPDKMIVVQGNNQSAKAGAQLSVPIVLRVTGGNNIPMPGVNVSFTLSGGSVTPASAVTNATGEVTVRWTIGPAGQHTLEAFALALTPVQLAATAN